MEFKGKLVTLQIVDTFNHFATFHFTYVVAFDFLSWRICELFSSFQKIRLIQILITIIKNLLLLQLIFCLSLSLSFPICSNFLKNQWVVNAMTRRYDQL